MSRNIFLSLLFFLFCGICYSQKIIPSEPGDTSTFYNETTNKYYKYTLTRNDPYAIPRSGFDFKWNLFLSKYSGLSFGVNHFKRPNPYNEYRYAVGCLLNAAPNDTSHNSNSTIITNNNIIYYAEYRYIRFLGKYPKKHFFGKRIIKNEYPVIENPHRKNSLNEGVISNQKQAGLDDWHRKYSHDKRINNKILEKTLIHYGISIGIQNFYGNFNTTTNQLINTASYGKQPVYINQKQKYVFPFESMVLSAGVEKRRSTYWIYRIDEKNDTSNTSWFWISGSYARLLYAPILYNKYIGTDMQVHNNFSTFKSHIGFAIGTYVDFGGPGQATVETGIIPGLGFYFKIGCPFLEFSLHRSKKNMDGTDYDFKWWKPSLDPKQHRQDVKGFRKINN